jgi:ubiquinone/menaquinone biosynthesis C-methylase UbiE
MLLDVGTAYGRDIKYGSKVPGLRIIGIDNSDGFIEILREMEKKQEIPPDSYRKADMRDLSCFPDGSFDIVRYHASLHHLPMIGKGYMADKALSEGYRVLKNSGIIYISVKKGAGIKYDDTQEGLGKFLCQYHSTESISTLLERNHFKEIRLSERPSSRGKHISWISIIAEKGGHKRNDSDQQ